MTEASIGEHLGKAAEHARGAVGGAYAATRSSLDGFSKGVQKAATDGNLWESAGRFAGRHPVKITAAVVTATALGLAHMSRHAAGRDRSEGHRKA